MEGATGGTAGSTVMRYSPRKQLTPSKQSLNCLSTCSSAAGSGSQIGRGVVLGLEAPSWFVILKFMVTRFKSVHVGRPSMVGPPASTTWNGRSLQEPP